MVDVRKKLESLPPWARKVVGYMFKAYIAWSIIADITIIGGIVYLIFF